MKRARVWLVGLVLGVLAVGALPSAALGFGIETFAAVNCKQSAPECASKGSLDYAKYYPVEPEFAKAKAEGFTEAGGRVPYGVTTFKVNTEGSAGKEYPEGLWPEGVGKTLDPTKIPSFIRTDVAPGLSTNPFAPERCTMAKFDGVAGEVAEGAFLEPECGEGSEIGINHVVVYIPTANADVPLEGTVYNLEPGSGWASKFGVAVYLGTLGAEYTGLYAHTIINGNVEWGKQARGTNQGDYHDYFEIEVSPKLPLVSSRLSFFGNVNEEGEVGEGNFITNATRCGNVANLETRLALKDVGGQEAQKTYKPPAGIELEGCNSLEFPISFKLTPASTTTEQPNEFTAEASETHEPAETDSSQVKSATFTLPEGMTLNPSAAAGLEACKPSQAHEVEGTEKFTEEFGVGCPAGSKIGTVTLNVPTLPNGSLTGAAYLGGPQNGSIEHPPFTMYVVANNAGYNVSVRLVAHVITNETTGQVTTVFSGPPEQPFTSLAIHFERGVLAPVANPLLCGTPEGTASFEPTARPSTSRVDKFGVTVTGCAGPTPPFTPTQSTSVSTTAAGGHPSYTLNLARNDGTQYLSTVRTELPPGLIGQLSKAEECSAGVAESETAACPAGSKIGEATVLAGSGSTPYTFKGSVYLTNTIQGAPYGMSVKVPAVAGPFNFGTVVTIGKITVNPNTAQVIVESTMPRIRRGVPLRIRNISVAINKSGFMLNPTNCNAAATVSSLKGYALLGESASASATLSSPFQATGCSSLKFSPKFSATSSTKVSRANGAMLDTTITQGAGQANIKYVKVQLPKQLPSRQSTLKQACLEKVFAADPFRCGAGSFVGGARVESPALPRPLTGPAILVSHAGASFPDLDLVLEDPNHLRIILTGNTNITKGITTTTFASNPDAPISKVTVNLPTGSHSALGAYGALCKNPLVEPTTIKSQNGKTIKQNTIINVAGCGVQVVHQHTSGNNLYLTVRVPAAGRVSVSAPNLVTTYKHASKAFQNVSLRVPLSGTGRRRFKPLTVSVRIGFQPKKGHASSVHQRVTFR